MRPLTCTSVYKEVLQRAMCQGDWGVGVGGGGGVTPVCCFVMEPLHTHFKLHTQIGRGVCPESEQNWKQGFRKQPVNLAAPFCCMPSRYDDGPEEATPNSPSRNLEVR